MGKKAKNKNKVSGAVKTATKTEKKAALKLKKELVNLGEEDIEKVLAQIEREEAKRNAVVEKVLTKPPEPRAYATFTPHPLNTNELILFGGEHHDGKKTIMYNDFLIYNTITNQWKKIKVPGSPPPRSAHQAVATASNKGELWIFGGEFTSPSETQFHHYRDLWVYSFAEKKWEKVQSPDGPSSRSGHRMALMGKKIYLFGGYHDNGRDYKYFNDVYCFDLESREWSKVEVGGKAPAPRSGCILLPGGNDSLVVYGGYARVKVGKQEQSVTYKDFYRLAGGAGKWRWSEIGRAGGWIGRAGASAAMAPSGHRAYVFGGITDVEETEEELVGEMSNELKALEVETARWFDVTLRSENTPVDTDKNDSHDSNIPDISQEESAPVTVITDDVFTMKLGGTSKTTNTSPNEVVRSDRPALEQNAPSPRMNAMLAMQKSVLYVYGGILEKREKQFTLSDMYSLDLHKLREWKTLIEQSELPEWIGSSSDEYESGSEEEGSDSESDDSEED